VSSYALWSTSARISNCIHKSNLIISHARPIKVPIRCRCKCRTFAVVSDPSSFSVPHYYYPRSQSGLVGNGMPPLYNSFAKRIQKCWWDYYMLLIWDWGYATRLQVEYLNAPAGLYLFNAVDCFVFLFLLPLHFGFKP